MAHSFNPKNQEQDLTSKVVVGLEKISEVFRVLLWERAKETGLSPIQIQLLIFINNHDSSLANVSHLSREFNLKKPTVSDAIKVLYQKELIQKEVGSDARAYTILLTSQGRKLVEKLELFDTGLRQSIDKLKKSEKDHFFNGLVSLISDLNKAGIIGVQRTCHACKFLDKKGSNHYCRYIQKELLESEIRLDCNDYQPIAD